MALTETELLFVQLLDFFEIDGPRKVGKRHIKVARLCLHFLDLSAAEVRLALFSTQILPLLFECFELLEAALVVLFALELFVHVDPHGS